MKNYLPALIVLMIPVITAIVLFIVARLSNKSNEAVDVQASDLANTQLVVTPDEMGPHVVRQQRTAEDDEEEDEAITPFSAVYNLNHRAAFPPDHFPELYP